MNRRDFITAGACPVFGDLDLVDRLFRMARPPTVRTMRQFAEQEIVVPDGPFAGELYRADRQPYAELWFEGVDSGLYRRHAAAGPTQSGKTLTCFIIPILYHLFETGENVVVGIPSLDMVKDKWGIDIEPAIKRSHYGYLLPTSGTGSRGGIGVSVQFRNGAIMRFMTGGGGDKGRAHFTTRVVVITEADGMDKAGEASKEADPITQLEARARAYGDAARIYMECTYSTKQGRIYREIINGTRSRIVLPCPHCKQGVSPEREHLRGWQQAQTVKEARRLAEFCCPECGAAWTEKQRVRANAKAWLVHDNPQAAGTITFGFRWSAVNNCGLLLTAADFGEDEFNAQNAEDEENAEKEMCQFVWAVPYEPPEMDLTPLDARTLERRGETAANTLKGEVPEWAKVLTLGIDLGKRFANFVAPAWAPDATSRLIDYGTFEIPSDDLGVELATLSALRDFDEKRVALGWGQGGRRLLPAFAFIDCNYSESRNAVYQFCREKHPSGVTYFPARGEGNWHDKKTYADPAQAGRTRRGIEDHYYKKRLPGQKIWEIVVSSNDWKTFVHERLRTPPEQPGSMTYFYSPDRNEHKTLVKQLTAEKKTEDFIPGKGPVVKWKATGRANHYLDCTYLASAAAHLSGVRLLGRAKTDAKPAAGGYYAAQKRRR